MRRMTRIQALLAAGILALAGSAVGCNGKSSSAGSTDIVTDTVTVTEPLDRARGNGDHLRAQGRDREDRPGRPDAAGRVRAYPVAQAERGRIRPPFRPRRVPDRRDRERGRAGRHRLGDVPNDYYVVDEGHRPFTYIVPADAHVTVLADGVDGTPITVAQLAKIVKGGEPLGHPLFEPLETGVWILIDVDTVRSIDQQYVP